MRAHLSDLSIALNRLLGGLPGETLCGRAARLWGVDCILCRVVGFVLREDDHCARQLIPGDNEE